MPYTASAVAHAVTTELPDPACAITSTEWRERAFERTPATEVAFECAAEEPDGVVCVWNGTGHVIEISPSDRTAVASLLLAGQLHPRHVLALSLATTLIPHTHVRLILRELLQVLALLVPGPA